MPEGDSLHRIAQRIAPLLVGQTVVRVSLPRATQRTEGLEGATVVGVEARGKNLLVHFSTGHSLHVHLKMRGRVDVAAPHRSAGGEVVATIETATHAIVVRSAPVARLLRTVDVVRDLAFRDLGPDLLGPTFDESEALRRLRQRAHLALGEALLDQGGVAGIGNVWKSELCFNLRLDPFASVALYSDDELRALVRLAREQLRENVDAPRRTLPDPFELRGSPRVARRDRRAGESRLSVYERGGEPCFDCGATIERRAQGSPARSTYLCPGCQPPRTS